MPRPRKSNRADGRFEVRRVIGYRIDGTPISKSFYGSNKDEALLKYADYLKGEEDRSQKKKATPFEEVADIWLYKYKVNDVKESSFITSYKRPTNNYIIPFFRDKNIQEIQQVDIKEFFNKNKRLSPSLLDKLYINLHGMFEMAIDNEFIERNPCRNIKIKSTYQKEDKRVYDKKSTDFLCMSNQKYAYLVHIILRCGLRASEVCGLRWEDIDLQSKTLSVRQAITYCDGTTYVGTPKSLSSVRTIPITDDLVQRLSTMKGKGCIAINSRGKQITPTDFSRWILRDFYNHEGVPQEQRLSAHELRHTCGTLLYEQTKDIYYVSKFLGHSGIEITSKIYVHSAFTQDKVKIISSKLRQNEKISSNN